MITIFQKKQLLGIFAPFWGLLMMLVLMIPTTVAAQYRVVKGRVIDATTHMPLSGALVNASEVDGYSVLSNENGNYELRVPVFSTTLTVTAPGFNMVRIGLAEGEDQRSAALYPEVFSADYEKNTQASIRSQAADFRFSNAVSIEEEIQKRLGSDVHVVTRSGMPGIGSVMTIGGLNSLFANAQPLIVVDGVIYDQQYSRLMLHEGMYNNILSGINPADIESVEVMRSGTSLYGAKGSNGVILINTRRNHSMATRITASISTGMTLEPKSYDVMNGSQYRSYASDLLGTVHTSIKEFKFLNESPSYYYYPQYANNTDWRDLVYRTALTQNYGINVEGGDDVADYNLSLGYTNQESTLKKNDMDRLSIRFNSDIHLTSRFGIRFDASFANQTRNLRNDGAPENYTEGTPTSLAFLAVAKSPMLSPYTFSGGRITPGYIDVTDESYLDEALADYNNYNYKLANPLAVLEYGDAENKNRFENSIVNLSVTPKYTFGRHTTLSEHFSYNLVNTNEKLYIPLNGVPSYYVAGVDAYCNNEVRSMASKQNSVMSDTRLSYKRRYAAHQLHAFAGARINWETYTLSQQLGYNTSSDKIPTISSSLDHSSISGNSDKWTSLVWYAQAAYDYMQRYYAQVNMTAETSSRFGRDASHAMKAFEVPWALFPGVQTAWVTSNEQWFRVKGIDCLRLSVAFDVSGNDDINYYAGRTYLKSRNFLEDVSGLSIDNIGNTKLQWETTKRLTLGLDTRLLNNRLSLTLNYFRSTTDNLLMYRSLHWITGLDNNWGNGGSLRNNGFDVKAAAKVIARKDFQCEVGFSTGHYRNEVVKLADGQMRLIPTEVYGANILTEVGKTANLFYGFKTQGVFATSEEAAQANLHILADGTTPKYFSAGDMHFCDLNGDGIISDGTDGEADDRVVIGDPNPDFFGNIFACLAYKHFKLDVNFNYSLGNDVYNYMRSQMESGSRFMNQTTAMTQRWQTEGQKTDVPRVTFQDPMGNARFSDRWIEDGSYLRLKTLTLSYTLPVNSTLLQGFQFWIQANNLLTLTNYLGVDPEFAMTGSVIGQGIDLGRLAQSRSFVAGIKINL